MILLVTQLLGMASAEFVYLVAVVLYGIKRFHSRGDLCFLPVSRDGVSATPFCIEMATCLLAGVPVSRRSGFAEIKGRNHPLTGNRAEKNITEFSSRRVVTNSPLHLRKPPPPRPSRIFKKTNITNSIRRAGSDSPRCRPLHTPQPVGAREPIDVSQSTFQQATIQSSTLQNIHTMLFSLSKS